MLFLLLHLVMLFCGKGAMPVSLSVSGIIQLLDSMKMENTGTFFIVNKDGSTKEFPW